MSLQDIQTLRTKTGAGMADCKKALTECGGDLDKAVEYLQKKSLAAATKRADKVAAEGVIASYVHNGRIGVIVEINCETDFVARNDDFKAMGKDIAVHIAAYNPLYLSEKHIPAEQLAKQKEIFAAQLLEQGKPAAMVEKIMDGKLKKWYTEVCLLDQPFLNDNDITVGAFIVETAARIKEKIEIRRFYRLELGEGIEKLATDFAAEVAATASGT
jgi:elongation factor Ts